MKIKRALETFLNEKKVNKIFKNIKITSKIL